MVRADARRPSRDPAQRQTRMQRRAMTAAAPRIFACRYPPEYFLPSDICFDLARLNFIEGGARAVRQQRAGATVRWRSMLFF